MRARVRRSILFTNLVLVDHALIYFPVRSRYEYLCLLVLIRSRYKEIVLFFHTQIRRTSALDDRAGYTVVLSNTVQGLRQIFTPPVVMHAVTVTNASRHIRRRHLKS